ncbi:hypothetical protein DOY81_008904 [Sarcophaga bullata]|nr:hypothetical protein DOY81_008904 [Sarcophaga bullata]
MLSIGPPTTISPNLLGLEGSKHLNGDPDNSALTGRASKTISISNILLPVALLYLSFVCSSWRHNSLSAIVTHSERHQRRQL